MSSENQRNASTNRERKRNAPINVKPQGRGAAGHLREIDSASFSLGGKKVVPRGGNLTFYRRPGSRENVKFP